MHQSDPNNDRSTDPSYDGLSKKLRSEFNTLARLHGPDFLIDAAQSKWLSASSQRVCTHLSKSFGVAISQVELRDSKDFAGIVKLIAAKIQNSTPRLTQSTLPPLTQPSRSRSSDPQKDLMIGSQIGPYVVEALLGQGGFATVVRARHKSSQRYVAIKVAHTIGGGRAIDRMPAVTSTRRFDGISPDEIPAEVVIYRPGVAPYIDLVEKPDLNALLGKEYTRLSGLNDKRVVSVHEIVQFAGRSALVLDFNPHRTLRELIRSMEAISLRMFFAVAETCKSIGGHGDLKPENILPGKGTAAFDATLIDPAVEISKGVTTIRAQTPLYNPLLLTGERADVFAIGVMLYEIAAGRPPFDTVPYPNAGEEGGLAHDLDRAYFLSYVPVEELNKKVSEKLSKLIQHCITVPDFGLDGFIKECREFINSQ